MASHSIIPQRIPFRTAGRLSGAAIGLLVALILIGVVAAFLARGGEDPGRLWQALLFNWLFWSSLAMGMVILAVAVQTVEAEWAWSVRRFATGGAAFLPISFVLLLVVLFGGHEHYFHHWLHPEGEHARVILAKRAWLNWPGLAIRDIVLVIVLYGLSLVFAYHSLRPDLQGAGTDDRQRSLYRHFTGGWRGAAEEARRSRRIVLTLGPIIALLFAVLWGIVGVDLAMSLEPAWFSTMFPVAFFIAAFVSGIHGTTLAVVFFRDRAGLTEYIVPKQLHDLGKLMFAFSVFWMYINWSQYVIIWYGQLPFEQVWFAKRLVAPYSHVTKAVVVLVFLLPFFGLVARPPKKVPAILGFFATLALVGIWLERFMIVVPSIAEPTGHLPLGIPEIGIGLGFMGLFLAAYLWFVSSFPLLPSPAALAARPPSVFTVQTAGAGDH